MTITGSQGRAFNCATRFSRRANIFRKFAPAGATGKYFHCESFVVKGVLIFREVRGIYRRGAKTRALFSGVFSFLIFLIFWSTEQSGWKILPLRQLEIPSRTGFSPLALAPFGKIFRRIHVYSLSRPCVVRNRNSFTSPCEKRRHKVTVAAAKTCSAKRDNQ